jgi:hypothetical protein
MYIQVHCSKIDKFKNNGSFQKTSIPPPQRKLEVNPPTPFGCPNTFTIIRNNFISPSDGRNFLCWRSVDFFWNDPIKMHIMKTLIFTIWLIWDIAILAVQWIKMAAKIYVTCQKILDWQAIFFLCKLFVLLGVIFNLLLNFLGVSLSSRGY